jgi:surfeit locus 1 family protein
MSRAWVVLLAALLGVAVTARLGVWQLQRAAQKLAVQHAIDERSTLPELTAAALAVSPQQASELHYRHVRLRGQWLHPHTVFLDNRPLNGRPGFIVVTPLRLADSGPAVVVQRGWVPRDTTDRTRLPAIPAPGGEVLVTGLMAPPPSRLYEFVAAASGVIRQNLDVAEYERETGLRLAPLSVLQDAAPASGDAGLVRQWPRPALDVHKHYGYAFQWFALCALMTGLYVWFQLVRPRLQHGA